MQEVIRKSCLCSFQCVLGVDDCVLAIVTNYWARDITSLMCSDILCNMHSQHHIHWPRALQINGNMKLQCAASLQNRDGSGGIMFYSCDAYQCHLIKVVLLSYSTTKDPSFCLDFSDRKYIWDGNWWKLPSHWRGQEDLLGERLDHYKVHLHSG